MISVRMRYYYSIDISWSLIVLIYMIYYRITSILKSTIGHVNSSISVDGVPKRYCIAALLRFYV